MANQNLNRGDVALLGIPLDHNSSYMTGPALAPQRIREALHCGSANMTSETGYDLGADSRFKDFGDLKFSGRETALSEISDRVAAIIALGAKVLSLGGDHSVSAPLITAHAKAYPGLNILHFDAHSDLYDELDGNRDSHACPFARIMETGLVKRLVQVGIRTLNQHQKEQAERFGVEIIQMKDWKANLDLSFDGPLYLSIDLDVLDPAFAPGVSHHEPGGMSVRELINSLHKLDADLVGADIVELNPHRDLVGMTAMVGAKLVKEVGSRLLKNG
ncbi:agmatinase [Kiloniella laminariae]|uniref:Agmatinase n=1 Tax=Kiloniella laminariae TaxID=454162 RepID=A0ABT4LMB2_9PROT|nr:agmatinase [Kiloniella laminariae]MCZ4282251.1 agmatinase [Kiloniella laminariae]